MSKIQVQSCNIQVASVFRDMFDCGIVTFVVLDLFFELGATDDKEEIGFLLEDGI